MINKMVNKSTPEIIKERNEYISKRFMELRKEGKTSDEASCKIIRQELLKKDEYGFRKNLSVPGIKAVIYRQYENS